MKRREVKLISILLSIAMLISMMPFVGVDAYAESVGVAQIICGSYRTGLLKTDSSLWMSGANVDGFLEDGTDDHTSTPVKVMDDVAQVSFGERHTGILKTDGSLWMIGYNGLGQLGDGTKVDKSTPVKVMDDVAQVSCGNYTTGILKTDGSLWMTGENDYGQLGDGTTENKSTPVKVMDNVVQVSCGKSHTGILKTDNSLWMTGGNWVGQLGDGTKVANSTPIKVMDGVAQVSCMSHRTGILKIDGSLWMTGGNANGSIGDGTDDNKFTPVKVMDDVAQVSGGNYHTGILKTDGSLWMTGLNYNGQLGDGTKVDKSTPVKVMDDVAQVSCGDFFTGVMKTDGSLWMTGSNSVGQLGDGTTESKCEFVKVMDGDTTGADDPDDSDPFTEGDIKFNYIPSYDDAGTASTTVFYSDSFFLESNKSYSHELATASLGMGMASSKKENIKAFLVSCGFKDDKRMMQSERYDLSKTNDEDKVAFTIASKTMNNHQVLIAISLRGGGYGNEWGSNGRVGCLGVSKGYHYGFSEAAKDVVNGHKGQDGLKGYCAKKNIDLKKAKVWITGYSRSAAVANLLGEKLEREGLVDKDNLYCYGFATPRTVRKGNVNKNVQGIYNIVNPLDVVPNVPLNASTLVSALTGFAAKFFTGDNVWDYTRHGNTLELPSALGTSGFKDKQNKMSERFFVLTDYDYKRFDGVKLQLLLDILVSVSKSERHYVEKLQDQIIVPALEDKLGPGGATDDTRILQIISLMPGARQLLINKGFIQEDNAKAMQKRGGIAESTIFMQHWPETYMAWMKTGYEPKKASAIKSIFVQCPVDVEVYDQDNELVARIVNDTVDESVEGRLEAYVDEAGAKTVFMPSDAEYNIKLIATDDGEMTYSVREFNEETEFQRKTVFENIPIEKDQIFTGEVDSNLNTDATNYALESNGQTIDADYDFAGNQLNTIEISADVTGEGIVMGAGLYTYGDSVVLNASSTCNNAFDGWYSEDGTLISKDPTLMTVADSNKEFKAVFTNATHEFGDWTVTKAATEIAKGQKTRSCSLCGETETKTIAQLKPTLPSVKISTPKAAKKAATIKWKKVSKKHQKKIAKIQIQYSTDKNFKKNVKTVYAKKSVASKKITKLKSKKTYYVRIRAYKKSGGAVHVSKWSTRKSIKIK